MKRLKRAPRRLRLLIMSIFIWGKLVIGVFAFKAIEVAFHTGLHTDFAIAGIISATILIPVLGLQALLEELD